MGDRDGFVFVPPPQPRPHEPTMEPQSETKNEEGLGGAAMEDATFCIGWKKGAEEALPPDTHGVAVLGSGASAADYRCGASCSSSWPR